MDDEVAPTSPLRLMVDRSGGLGAWEELEAKLMASIKSGSVVALISCREVELEQELNEGSTSLRKSTSIVDSPAPSSTRLR